MHYSALDDWVQAPNRANRLQRLGLSCGASKDQIKEAYRQLVRQHHPDKGGDCEAFRSIQEAYEGLCTETMEQDGFAGEEGHLNWMFETMKDEKTSDRHLDLRVSRQDLLAGCTASLSIQRRVLRGGEQGLFERTTCLSCVGSGREPRLLWDEDTTYFYQEPCSACEGRGCFLPSEVVCQRVEVEVPRHSGEGTRITLRGMADDERPFREPGDVIVTCRLAEDGGEDENPATPSLAHD